MKSPFSPCLPLLESRGSFFRFGHLITQISLRHGKGRGFQWIFFSSGKLLSRRIISFGKGAIPDSSPLEAFSLFIISFSSFAPKTSSSFKFEANISNVSSLRQLQSCIFTTERLEKHEVLGLCWAETIFLLLHIFPIFISEMFQLLMQKLRSLSIIARGTISRVILTISRCCVQLISLWDLNISTYWKDVFLWTNFLNVPRFPTLSLFGNHIKTHNQIISELSNFAALISAILKIPVSHKSKWIRFFNPSKPIGKWCISVPDKFRYCKERSSDMLSGNSLRSLFCDRSKTY